MNNFLSLLRPYHWIKNLLIFAPIFFAGRLFEFPTLISTIYAFLAFSLTASSGYIINDIIDRATDAQHLKKKNRAIASGEVSSKQAFLFFLAIALTDILFIAFLIPQIWYIITIYFLLNLLYSFCLKHIPIFDIGTVSSFYVMRAMTGGIATGIPISEWLLVCTFFASLLLVTGKRKASTHLLYSPSLLQSFLLVSASLTVMSYSLYSILAVSSSIAIYSIVFVVVGVFRYLFLCESSSEIEYPEKIILSDKTLSLTIFSWLMFMYIIFYCYT